MERVKPFWFVLVTLLASVTLLLAASCGGDSDEEGTGDGSGGTAGASGSGASGSGATSGGGSMSDASVDGSASQPRSTGTVPENGTCTSGGGMLSFLTTPMTGTCRPSGTECPGGQATSSDCAAGLVCCIGPDQCDAVAPDILASGRVESVSCVTTGSCPSSTLVLTNAPIELPGCPEGQSCCITLPDGGISLEAGIGAFLDSGIIGRIFEGGIFEGGFPAFEGGVPSREAGTSTPTSDAGTTPTVDAGEQ
jgi:hypothetical protein